MNGLLVVAVVLGVVAPAPDQVRERAAAIEARGGYQRDLPVATSEPQEPRRGTARAPVQRYRPPDLPVALPPPVRLPALPLDWLALGGLGVLLAWAAFKVFGNWHTSAGSTNPPVDPGALAKTSSSLRGATGSADQLARAGRFAEALHALLLQAIAELSRRCEVAGSLTTRELLHSAAATLRDDGQAALRELAASVERVHFGGRAALEEDYQQGLSAYRRFADACRR
jgi:hypothetical protein